MANQNQRLREIWDSKAPCSQREFGARYGIGSVGMVSQYLLGRRPLNLAAATKFAEGLRVPLEDISPELARLAKRAAAAASVEGTAVPGGKQVPVLGYVQAGLPTAQADPDVDEWATVDLDDVDLVYGLRIRGDSMLPLFKEGDLVIIDRGVAPVPGDFVVARIAGEDDATFKKFAARGVDGYGRQQFDLIPLNDDYPTLRSTDQDIAIDGVMIEHRSYRRKH